MPRQVLAPDECNAAYCGRIFGRSPGWFGKNRASLELEMSFPKPKPRPVIAGAERGPRVWIKAEVDAWCARRRAGLPEPANQNAEPKPGTDDSMAARRAQILGAM